MSFRLGMNMQLSSPPVMLSTGLIQQLERSNSMHSDLEKLVDLQLDSARLSWPYLGEDGLHVYPDLEAGEDQATSLQSSHVCRSSSSLSDPPAALTDDDLEFDLEPQPSVDLQVRLSEYIPGCDTLLVEVAPACLVHNSTDMDIVLAAAADGQQEEDTSLRWTIRSGQTMAPPLAKDHLKLSVKYKGVQSEEKIIPVSNESSDYRRYNDDLGRVLFMDSFVHVTFKLSKDSKTPTEVAFLTITSDLQHGIRVICVREKFSVSNRCDVDLNTKLIALPLSLTPVKISGMEGTRVVCQSSRGSKDSNPDKQIKPSLQQDCIPLYRWSLVERGEDSPRLKAEGEEQQTFVCYVSFSLASRSEDIHRTHPEWVWSLPVRLVSSKDSRRTTTSIPDICVVTAKPQESPTSDGTCQSVEHIVPVTEAVCVTSQQVKGVTHLVLSKDLAPAIVVENLCPFNVQFGQACEVTGISGAVIQEQVELVSDLPWVPANGWCHYTPQTTNTEFVNKEAIVVPKLFLRACDLHSSPVAGSDVSEWSPPIETSSNTDLFLQLRGLCDLKLTVESVGMVTHLVVRPVSKAEVSAREIRSRLKGPGTDHITSAVDGQLGDKFGSSLVKWRRDSATGTMIPETDDGSSSPTDVGQGQSDQASVVSSLSKASAALAKAVEAGSQSARGRGSFSVSAASPALRFSEVLKMAQSGQHSQSGRKKKTKDFKGTESKSSLNVGFLCGSFSLYITDESMLGQHISSLMAVHLQEVLFAMFPVARGPNAVCSETSFAVSVGDAQIDNQRYGVGTYDFPVIFLPQRPHSSTSDRDSSYMDVLLTEGMSIMEIHAIMRSKSFCHIQMVTFNDPVWQQSAIESVDVDVKPFSVYIDDTFVYRVMEEMEAFTPSRLCATLSRPASPVRQGLSRKLPTAVELNSLVLSRPLRIGHLNVKPLRVLLSVHASVRLFLASDHTPLSLASFQRDRVFCSTQRLVHAVTMHYASAAIFRAGIVVGSLEILGNPTGLVRSIGTGVTDLVSLPYSGLTQGPSAFISGLSRGVGSLFRNISAGTITSVTNLASSISRNMDRLSLDSGHRQRQEESRRHRPAGLTDGLRQGLTGFGISLLGAVAGLADHPIQTLLGTDTGAAGLDDRRGSSTASGLVTGVGKGLVGVLTKPIGGAAEFVSQTGQGLLHGTGLGQMACRMEEPETWSRQDIPHSVFKTLLKVLPLLASPHILLSMPALTRDPSGQEVDVHLLLTPDALVVVDISNSEDTAVNSNNEGASSSQDIPQQQQQQHMCHQVLSLAGLKCGSRRASSVNLIENNGVGSNLQSKTGESREAVLLVVHWQDQVFTNCRLLEDSQTTSQDRVAAFIDTQTGQAVNQSGLVQFDSIDQSDETSFTPQMEDNVCKGAEASQGVEEEENPQYEFVLSPDQLELFLSAFRLAKNTQQGRGFPI